ncbi:MAPEG family protein [Agarivorans sp. DSG3-1]|uniref:MAPEG family protein n=1 Tax=Agarivorans sp. DSG3-1 TaxID=3342249 RepID=UPI00398E3B2E
MVYAIFVLFLLTGLVGLISVKTRALSVKNGLVSADYFKLMQAQDVPVEMIKTTRCFNNLFEVPVLFYAVCSIYIGLGIDSIIGLLAAWTFVIARCAQAYIHITYNKVKHRRLAFATSVLCVATLWCDLLIFEM